MSRSLLRIARVILGLTLSFIAGDSVVANDAVVSVPVPNDPTISFRIWFNVGSQNDPPGKEGIAALTGAMMSEAATTRNSTEQILDKLFPLATSYDASVGVEMTVITGRVHKDNLEAFYPLLMDAILRPAFAQADLERLRSRALNSVENILRYASDEELGKAVLYGEIFAGTRYAHLTMGTVQSLKSITVDDLRAFHRTHFTRDNVVIGIGGGYAPDLVERLKKDLASLPAGAPTPVPPPALAPVKGMNVTIVEKDAPATAISMGFPISVLRGSREWYALAIANSWLGEHRNSSSHLYQVIRETRGLNYGDYSYIEHFPNGGRRQMPPQNVARRRQIFEIWIRPVPNEAGHFALRAALREFKALVEKGMTREDVDLTKGFLRKYVLHYAPTTMDRLGYALDDRYYGLHRSHLETFRTMMQEITQEEVNAAIRKHFQFGTMHIAIVTRDAPSLKEALMSNASSPITYPTPKSEQVLAEDREISAFPLPIGRDDVKIVKVADLFERP